MVPAQAGSDDRTLYLYHFNTKKSGTFTFRRNGQYDPRVLKQLDAFLADWRTGEQTRMDPALYDLLWLVYRKVGATQPINIVSAYRSPTTNAMLRKKSSGVAENSQHMRGKAIDFFIPGVALSRVRETGMYYQVGGVGFYPTSGAPFVHLDTGSVRAWPRMTRAQLKRLFPDGRTLHLPTDGRPLSAEGRRYAEAQWNKCRMVPCKGAPLPPSLPASAPDVAVASLEAPVPATRSPDVLAPGSVPDDMEVASAEPAHRVVPVISVSGQPAPLPAQKSRALAITTATIPPVDGGETALVALARIGAPIPASRPAADAEAPLMVTAYVPDIEPDPGAQLALRMIIERETTGAVAPTPAQRPAALDDAQVQVASLGGFFSVTPVAPPPNDPFGALLEATWSAVTGGVGEPSALAAALQARVAPEPDPSFGRHEVELMAPDLEHVADTMVQQVPMSGAFYGDLYEPEGWLDKTTELGPLVTRLGIDPLGATPAYDRFVVGAPLLVAGP